MDFDAYAPEFIADPYPTFAALRESSPVFHDESWGLTFFTRHSDVETILKDRQRFGRDFRHRLPRSAVEDATYDRIYPSQYPTWTRYIRESFIDLEPPRHIRLRKLVAKAFTRRAAESFRPDLERQARALVNLALERGEIDGIGDYATPLPLGAIADLMGIPSEDRQLLLGWSNAIVRLFDKNVTPGEGAAAEAATIQFVSYLEDELKARRRNPGTDLISNMLMVEDFGETLTDEEIVGTSILTLNAGHEATVHAIGNGLLALARNPDQFAILPEFSATATDELLRFDTPLQMFERWVLEDVDDFGVELRAGTKVGLLFGSANHDGDAFAGDPEVLDLSRDASAHVSFSHGVHLCVGAPLARVELEVALKELASHVGTISLASSDVEHLPSLVFRGVVSLPLTVTARR